MNYKHFTQFYVLSNILLYSMIGLGEELKTSSPTFREIEFKILKKQEKKGLISFKSSVNLVVGKSYSTNIKDVTFKVLKISPQKTRAIGNFSTISFDLPPRLFLSLDRQTIKKVAADGFDVAPKKEKKNEQKKLSVSMFYTFSFGDFYEEVNGATAESSQNSPITLGVSTNYKFNSIFSFSGSTYFSKLNSVLATGKDETTKNQATIPWEYGITSYLEISGIPFFIKPYAGLDFESFSTFNTDELKNNSSVALDVRTHQFLYGTVGIFSFTKMFNRFGIFKASFSKNVTSTSSRNSTLTDEAFNGSKFIVFFGMNIWKKIGASVFYKRHILYNLRKQVIRL